MYRLKFFTSGVNLRGEPRGHYQRFANDVAARGFAITSPGDCWKAITLHLLGEIENRLAVNRLWLRHNMTLETRRRDAMPTGNPER